ncbi:succinyl-diaminopimelate desuccinylase [Parvularcula sp. ZS-1/3]|uniref:Succinyl-diaminopimelate desuccinylase n=1 Tax=Parvularcula mediterranea TaxID=2732508 RepID=A0A7Y3RL65_9PROT|nr:succinyl-diaminopimelate desuccinylase [Parvularcula mediterranea]NNU16127.1 succinyl-diaminopimelate desuccinylase [Parvularcula mediterranea]
MTETPLHDPIALAKALMACPSVTPVDAGAQDLLETWLERLGFEVHRVTFGDVPNLYATRGQGQRLCFAGHTDVVPPGQVDAWTSPPFEPSVEDGMLRGRGASDMKGAIAAFLAAIARAEGTPPLSLLITGDEEGPGLDGTKKMLGWMAEQGYSFDHCLVGEPTSREVLGDMMKVGRRGSMNAIITIEGRQGHVAYPHRAENPMPAAAHIAEALASLDLDGGYEHFQPSNLEVTGWGSAKTAENVIPADAWIRLNVRFNPNWTGETLVAHLETVIGEAAGGAKWSWHPRVSGEAFLNEDPALAGLVTKAVRKVTGRAPELSTSGGTSDARFIAKVSPCVEFGLSGQTMHQVDEQVPAVDVERLTDIYSEIIALYKDGL